jgi:TRAP-type C4-dicarboxylate transport system substrate-binding protein
MTKTTRTLSLAVATFTAAAVGAVSASAETFTLRVGSGHPNGPAVYVADVADFFVPEVVRRVAEETEHEVEFVEGYGGAIAGVAETLEAVQNGILDIGAYCICFEPAKLFLHNFPYYAPFGPQDSEQQMQAVRAVYDQVPWLTEQFTAEYDQELLGLHGWDNYHLGTTNPWETVEDLQGVKIGGAGPNLPWLEFAGAVPVQSTLPDGYMSLQTGVYDGWLMFPSAYLGFKFYEPSPHYTLIGFGAMGVNALTANNRTMSRLPEDVANIIREVGREYEARAGANLNARQESGLKGLEEVGAQIKELGEEARAGWAASLASFPAQQAADADGRGMPGTEVMKAYIAAVDATGYEWPYTYSIE